MIKTLTFEEQQDLLKICENLIKLLGPIHEVFPQTEVGQLVGQAKASMAKLIWDQPASETTHTPGPWKKRLVADKMMIVGPSIGGQSHIVAELKHNSEANGDLIALAPTMRDALLKVRRWRQVEHNFNKAVVGGKPELADLMKQSQKLESEFEAVIDQIEAGQ